MLEPKDDIVTVISDVYEEAYNTGFQDGYSACKKDILALLSKHTDKFTNIEVCNDNQT